MSVSICCKPDKNYNDWVKSLQLLRLDVTRIWPPPPGRLSADMDILICEYFPQMVNLIPWVPGAAEGALILLLPEDGNYDDDVVLSVAPQCILQYPFTKTLITTTVKVAWSQYKYEQRLLDRVAKLDENVRSARDVERVKLIIMNNKKLNERAAYKYLRDMAMQRQETVSSLVASIIKDPDQIMQSH